MNTHQKTNPWALFTACIVAVALVFQTIYLFQLPAPKKPVANVNGVPIFLDSFPHLYTYSEDLVQDEIIYYLLFSAANNAQIVVTEEMLVAAITSNPLFQSRGVFSPQLFDRYCITYGKATLLEAFTKQVKSHVILSKLAKKYQLPSEIFKFLEPQFLISYSLVPANSISVSYTVQDLRTFYAEHGDRYKFYPDQLVAWRTIADEEYMTEIGLRSLYAEQISALSDCVSLPETRSGYLLVLIDRTLDIESVLPRILAGENVPGTYTEGISDDARVALFLIEPHQPYLNLRDNEYLVLDRIVPASTKSFDEARSDLQKILREQQAGNIERNATQDIWLSKQTVQENYASDLCISLDNRSGTFYKDGLLCVYHLLSSPPFEKIYDLVLEDYLAYQRLVIAQQMAPEFLLAKSLIISKDNLFIFKAEDLKQLLSFANKRFIYQMPGGDLLICQCEILDQAADNCPMPSLLQAEYIHLLATKPKSFIRKYD